MRVCSLFVLCSTSLFAIAPAMAQDAAAGAKAFSRCSACHAVTADKPSTLGPNLAGVVGRRAGSLNGYSYSPAMKTAGYAWTADRIATFISNPRTALNGTKMYFAGVADAKTRLDLIAYLATLKK